MTGVNIDVECWGARGAAPERESARSADFRYFGRESELERKRGKEEKKKGEKKKKPGKERRK